MPTYEFHRKQIRYQLQKTNDPPDLNRYAELVKRGHIDVEAKDHYNVSVIDEINEAKHIKEQDKEKIKEICLLNSYKKKASPRM